VIRTIINSDDLEYIINAHCRIYSREYNFDDSFRQFIVRSVNNFMHNNKKEQIWIVDLDGHRRGSIGIVDAGNGAAQLRWFLIEPECRGKGYGRELMEKAIQHSKDFKFEKIILFTHSQLLTARKLYANYGFKIAESHKEMYSGQEVIEERWELNLQEPAE
jgi:ribosomal protein S18 acetylase RimI-like enzyme